MEGEKKNSDLSKLFMKLLMNYIAAFCLLGTE
jgi:hypothetical protein